jgi:hypothetical protein
MPRSGFSPHRCRASLSPVSGTALEHCLVQNTMRKEPEVAIEEIAHANAAATG